MGREIGYCLSSLKARSETRLNASMHSRAETGLTFLTADIAALLIIA